MGDLLKKTDDRTIQYQGEHYKVDGGIAGRDAVQISHLQGETFEISGDEFRAHVQRGLVRSPLDQKQIHHLTADDASERHFRTRVVERALELAAEGHTWKDRMPILKREFDESEEFRTRRKNFPTQPTIQKWQKEYRSGGPESLAPRTRNSGNRSPRCDFLFREIVLDILEQDYTTSDRETLTRVHQKAVDQYIVICEERGIEPGNCGRKVVEAIVKTIPHYDILKWQLGSKTAQQQMRTAQKFMTVEIPFDRIEIDCTEADIILADDDRNAIGRPYVCSAIDCASAWIVAQRITLHRPTSEDIAIVLRELMTLPDEEFFEEHRIVNRMRIAAKPKMVVWDQGGENNGGQIDSFIDLTGVYAHWARPKNPQEKPFIERLFGNLRGKVSQLPGATKSKAYPNRTRTQKAMDEASLTLEEFNSVMQRWRFDEYGRTPKRAVEDIYNRRETPTAAWNRLANEHLIPDPPSAYELDAALMLQTDTRAIWHHGIEFCGMQYHSQDLANLYLRIGSKKRVTIRYSPLDIREIRVVDPDTGDVIIAENKVEGLAAITFRELKESRPPRARHNGPIRTAEEINLDIENRRAQKLAGKSKMQKSRAAVLDRLRATDVLDRSTSKPGIPGQIPATKPTLIKNVVRSRNLPKIERKNAGSNE